MKFLGFSSLRNYFPFVLLFFSTVAAEKAKAEERHNSANVQPPVPAQDDFNISSHYVSTVTSKDFHLKKTIFNDHVRLLIVAGLEGTGHHAISAMLSICTKKVPAKCEVENSVSTKVMSWYPKEKALHGLFGAADAAKALRQAVSVRKSLELVANKTGNHLYFLGLGNSRRGGMFSYPNFNGKFKSLDHPDVYQLALLAEQAGVDYRVLVLQRNGLDILKSVDRRDFGKENEEPKILIDNAAVLHAQLALLDPQFFLCLQYERLNDLKKASAAKEREKIVRFLHPKNLGNGIFEEMLQQVRPSSKPDYNFTVSLSREHNSTLEYLAFMLNARNSMITDLCNKRRDSIKEK